MATKSESETTKGKPGRKPAAPYTPFDLAQPVAAVVTQSKTGAQVKLFPDPTSAATYARELAAKGKTAITFGPQTMLYRKATQPVEEVAMGAPVPPAAPEAPAAEPQHSTKAYGS